MLRSSILSLLVAGALGAQAVPARPEQIVFKPLAFEAPRAAAFKGRLANGIPVYVAEDPGGAPFIRIQVIIKGGSYLDPAGKEGLAAMTGAQMRDGGTRKTPASELDERLEFLAGHVSSGFGPVSGFVDMVFLDKDVKEGLDLFMQVLTQPAFAQERLDRAKEATNQSMSARNDAVNSILGLELPRLLYGEGHFASTQPTAASIAAITREDMRAFHARILDPANMVVSVSGRPRRKELMDMLEKTLGRLKAGPAAQVSPAVPVPTFAPRPGIYVVDKDVPQSLVNFSLPGLRRTDPDWHASVVLNEVLGGGGFTSRLMKKIRSDEGLTYGIGTQFEPGTYWKGRWGGSFQTKNPSVPYAMRLVLAEVERMKNEPVPAEELASIKAGLVEGFPSGWGSKASVVNLFASERAAGWPEDWWVDFRERIQAVTAQDVIRVARKYMDPSRMVILVVGKAAEAEAGDAKDHPGLLKDLAPLPLKHLPLLDPLTLKPLS